MLDEEKLFYRNLYNILVDDKIETLLRTYATSKFNTDIKKLRSKQETYEQGYLNGSLDCWQQIIDLKKTITKIMNNIG